MRVFHHSVKQLDDTQCRSFYTLVLRTFYATADAATALAELRNQIETTSIFFRNAAEANSANQSCDYVQPNSAVRCVTKKVRKKVLRLRYAALCLLYKKLSYRRETARQLHVTTWAGQLTF